MCNATMMIGTIYQQYEGLCPKAEGGAVPTLDNVCCLEYTQWYKRFDHLTNTAFLPWTTVSSAHASSGF